MCIVLLASEYHDDYKLIVIVNRDENLSKPSKSAHFWKEDINILGGLDLIKGGSQFALSKKGKFACVTNFRELPQKKKYIKSRGELVRKYLTENLTITDFIKNMEEEEYPPFSILFGEPDNIWYYSNRDKSSPRKLETNSVFGLSNSTLDDPWYKVERGKQLLKNTNPKNFFNLLDILSDTQLPHYDQIQVTDYGREIEKNMASIFIPPFNIDNHVVGTCAQTILTINKNNEVLFVENFLNNDGWSLSKFRFTLS